MSTPERINYYSERILELQDRLSRKFELDAEQEIDLQIELAECEEQLNFAWQDDEDEWNYARECQEFNSDGSLVWY